jgi:hypothetical protein
MAELEEVLVVQLMVAVVVVVATESVEIVKADEGVETGPEGMDDDGGAGVGVVVI